MWCDADIRLWHHYLPWQLCPSLSCIPEMQILHQAIQNGCFFSGHGRIGRRWCSQGNVIICIFSFFIRSSRKESFSLNWWGVLNLWFCNRLKLIVSYFGFAPLGYQNKIINDPCLSLKVCETYAKLFGGHRVYVSLFLWRASVFSLQVYSGLNESGTLIYTSGQGDDSTAGLPTNHVYLELNTNYGSKSTGFQASFSVGMLPKSYTIYIFIFHCMDGLPDWVVCTTDTVHQWYFL